MKGVIQTDVSSTTGNCFPATVASILEVPLKEVPHPTEDDPDWLDYWPRFQEWLVRYGLGYIEFERHADGSLWTPEGFHTVLVKSPRGDWDHSVVGWRGRIVHDPYPGTTPEEWEKLEVKRFGVFYLLADWKERSVLAT